MAALWFLISVEVWPPVLGSTKIEVFHHEVPIEERRRRIQQRNIEKDPSVYFFNMSDEEFDRHNSAPSQAPPEEPGFKVTRKDNR